MNIAGAAPVLLAMDGHGELETMGIRGRYERRPSHPRSANVEIAGRCFDAFTRSFAQPVDDYYELLDPEVEWIPITALIDGRSYRGPEEVREWVDEVRRDWRAYEVRWTQARDLGDGRVLAFGIWDCVGRRSGVGMTFDHAAWLIDLRAARVVRMESFADRDEALAAAGLAARPRRRIAT